MSIWSTDLKAKLFNGSKVPYFKSDSKTLVLNTDILINSNFSHVCTAQYDGLLKFTKNQGPFLDFRPCKNHYLAAMHPGLKRLWIGFLILLMVFGILLSAKSKYIIFICCKINVRTTFLTFSRWIKTRKRIGYE